MRNLLHCKCPVFSVGVVSLKSLNDEHKDFPVDLRNLLSRLSATSPYIRELILKESSWLKDNLNTDIFEVIEALVEYCKKSNYQNLGYRLRVAKRRSNLLIALADFGRVLELNEVTKMLSYFAENIVETALNIATHSEFSKVKPQYFIESGKHYPTNPVQAASQTGVAAIAMGKLGAFELNYSSDIDLIFIFDEEMYSPKDYSKVRGIFINIIRKLVRLLSKNTENGYVYRVDLRLRPDPSSTPICIGVLAAQRYYENFGRNWERAAFIKARVVAGNKAVGAAFLKSLMPFVWRKNLDFAAIEDIDHIRRKIREGKGSFIGSSLFGYNIKTGMGGIREIEFFAQTQQLIFGGRNKLLRLSGTVEALQQLVFSNCLQDEIGAKLIDCYKRLRILEHALQLIDDKQTHSIPKAEEKLQNIAIILNKRNKEELLNHISSTISDVDNIIGEFYNKSPSDDISTFNKLETDTAPDPSVLNYLNKWSTYKLLRSDRSIKIFEELKPLLISEIHSGGNSLSTLFHFDQFLESLSSGVQVLSLFKANPSVLKLLIEICGAAPTLAENLSKNPAVLDYVTEPAFFDSLPSLRELQKDLPVRLSDAADFEEILDYTRIWVKENQFRTAIHLLKGFSTAVECARSFSNIAEVCLIVLFKKVKSNFQSRYGVMPGLGSVIIAMGKLGSKEMTFGSDLDLIIIYDAPAEGFSNGKIRVPSQVYFARLTQAFISALTVATSNGGLYKVDMRLRPSGKKGPIATSIKSFEYYQINEARVWELLALSRGRVLAGNKTLQRMVELIISRTLNADLSKKKIKTDVSEIRKKINENASAEFYENDPKYGSGRLKDLELLIQMGALIERKFEFLSPFRAIRSLKEVGFLDSSQAEICSSAYTFYFTLLQVLNITVTSNKRDDYSSLTQEIFGNYIPIESFEDIRSMVKHYSLKIDEIFEKKLCLD